MLKWDIKLYYPVHYLLPHYFCHDSPLQTEVIIFSDNRKIVINLFVLSGRSKVNRYVHAVGLDFVVHLV